MEKTLKKRLDEFNGVTGAKGLPARIAELMRELTALEHACAALERRRAAALAKPRRARKSIEPPRHEGTKKG
jgi:hypothetical protein